MQSGSGQTEKTIYYMVPLMRYFRRGYIIKIE